MVLDANWKVNQVEENYETVSIVFIHSEKVYGTVDHLGAYASLVRYTINGIEYSELLENDEFAIVDEIAFHHIIDDNRKNQE